MGLRCRGDRKRQLSLYLSLSLGLSKRNESDIFKAAATFVFLSTTALVIPSPSPLYINAHQQPLFIRGRARFCCLISPLMNENTRARADDFIGRANYCRACAGGRITSSAFPFILHVYTRVLFVQ